ncbi:MAG: pyridoxal phosphate-dependent decarboxylase family protein [Candidatus Cyclobacteriaceae bacterium M2_1C_046]
MAIWEKLPQEKIRERVFKALGQNVNYYNENILGVPASHLDDRVFYQDAPFLNDAPFLSTLIHNPNHIGCHTLGRSESFFKGTQEIEKELIGICAADILNGEPDEFDGYVASGGTEANMQAIWVYRNYFIQELEAKLDEIAIITSADAHYSMDKAANILNIRLIKITVKEDDRKIDPTNLESQLAMLNEEGVKHVICIANMMTTMFGSVDETEIYAEAFNKHELTYKIHVDGAYGGFYYPFAAKNNNLDFRNPEVNSVTLDAHKMLQAPYGTGIFIIRKNWIHFANTKAASYVEGEDYTLSGSRSGANAIAIWMILMTYGPHGWYEKILILNNRANWLCKQLREAGILYYRNENSNIITIRSEFVPKKIASKFGLVPDNHDAPNWYKIVIMDHVTIEKLLPFVEEGLNELKIKN